MLKGMYCKLPHYVYLKNERFNINTDFRIFIEFETEMQGKDKEKASIKCLKKFYPAFLQIIEKGLIEEAVDKFIWFYKCNKPDIQYKGKSTSKKKIFSYEYDDLYIWGAFKQYYKVDLTKDYIHWWKFKAMWLSIPSESEYNKIKGYRAYSGKDKEILEMQKIHEIPKTEYDKADEIRRNEIYESLKQNER